MWCVNPVGTLRPLTSENVCANHYLQTCCQKIFFSFLLSFLYLYQLVFPTVNTPSKAPLQHPWRALHLPRAWSCSGVHPLLRLLPVVVGFGRGLRCRFRLRRRFRGRCGRYAMVDTRRRHGHTVVMRAKGAGRHQTGQGGYANQFHLVFSWLNVTGSSPFNLKNAAITFRLQVYSVFLIFYFTHNAVA